MNCTVDDVSSITEDAAPVPAIAMVASGPNAASLVLPVPAELGRRIAAGGKATRSTTSGCRAITRG